MCIDYRGLNLITKKNSYNLPKMDELPEGLAGACFFSKLDLASRYYQVRMAAEDVEKTAFNSRYGHYEWLVMSFGMTNASKMFQGLMNLVFKDMLFQGVVIYLNDIVIYSSNKQEHFDRLKQVLQRLREHKLFAQSTKCEFLQTSIEYLGHVVDASGITLLGRHTDEEW